MLHDTGIVSSLSTTWLLCKNSGMNARRILIQLSPYFTAPILGILPLSVDFTEVYFRRYLGFLFLFASWIALLWLVTRTFNLGQQSIDKQKDPKLEDKEQNKGREKVQSFLQFIGIFAAGYLVLASLEVVRSDFPDQSFYILLSLLALRTIATRQQVLNDFDGTLIAMFLYRIGIGSFTFHLATLQPIWIYIVAGCSFAAIAAVFETSVRMKELASGSVEESKNKASKIKRSTTTLELVRPYLVLFVLGPFCIGSLAYQSAAPTTYLFPILSLIIFKDLIATVQKLPEQGELPPKFAATTANAGLLFILLTIIAGLI